MFVISLIDTKHPLTESVLESALKFLPKRLHGEHPEKDEVGWMYATNLTIAKNKYGVDYVQVYGSTTTQGIYALDMALSLQQILQYLGFRIEVFSIEFGFVNKRLYRWLGYDSKELDNLQSFIHH